MYQNRISVKKLMHVTFCFHFTRRATQIWTLKSSAATCTKVWRKTFYRFLWKYGSLSGAERNLRIGKDLTKLPPWIRWLCFEYKDVTTHNKGQVGSRFGWHCARSDVFTMGEKLMERYCVTSAQYGGRYITWYSDNRLTSRSPYASLLGTAWLAGGRVCYF